MVLRNEAIFYNMIHSEAKREGREKREGGEREREKRPSRKLVPVDKISID